MTTSAPVRFAYRCTGCYQVLVASADEVGAPTDCPHCGQCVTIPAVTPERIALAREASSTATPGGIASDTPASDAPWSNADIERELRKQLHVLPGEMLTLSTMTSAPTKRLFGWIIDNVLMVVATVAGFLLALVLDAAGLIKLDALLHEPTAKSALDLFNVLFVIYFLAAVLCIFQWWLISTRGQSIGKFLLGMRIVADGGRNPGFLQGVVLRNWLRALLSMLPFFALLDALFILGDSHRCIHDYIANTYVMNV